jgi:hypothetical protein
MYFNISYGDSIIHPVFSSNLLLKEGNKKITVVKNNSDFSFAITGDSALYVVDSKGLPGNVYPNFTAFKTASVNFGATEFVAGANDSKLNVLMGTGINSYLASIDVGAVITAPPVMRLTPTEQYNILIGTDNGRVLVYSLGSLPSNNPQILDSTLFDNSVLIKKIASSTSYYSVICGSKMPGNPGTPVNLFFDSNGNSFAFVDEEPVDLILTKEKTGKFVNIILTNKNNFYLVSEGKLISNFTTKNISGQFGMSDLKNDGENYIIFIENDLLYAVNQSGSSADNFPFEDPVKIGFTGIPLSADIEGDSKAELIAFTKDGRIFAIDGGTGKVVDGFPISSGAFLNSVPVLFAANDKLNLAVYNSKNNFSAWNISSVAGRIFWAEENGNNLNSSFLDAAAGNNFVSEFFPQERAYNYPNPVYETETQIRYYVSEDSKINIKIFDLAGDFVAELNDDAIGGYDNETTWSVNDIQSGVYLARIEASAASGKTESAIIKIAIVK